ncbi:MAG: NnrS family protein [Campylobacteraceae bacterium]|nr:NnrS family protein [Campylobacteraceae bacterium]
MQFSTSPNPQITKQSWKERFCSQPHQMFFVSAIFFSIFIMIMTLFSLIGKISLEFSTIHGFGLNYAVFTNAFLGFLITVIPKYNAAPAIKEELYIKPWIILQGGFFIGLLINAQVGKLIVALIMFYFAKIFYSTIKEGKALIKEDSIYLNSIFILGAVLLTIEALFTLNLSYLIFFAYLINMVYFVALRMIPGFYFTYTKINPWQKPKFIKPLSFVLITAVGISLQFDLKSLVMITSFLSFIFFTYVFIKLNMFKKTSAILQILVLGFAWFPLGFLGLFIESLLDGSILKLGLHIFALGFVTTLLIGFGSRVSLGHAIPAQPIVADELTKWLFVLTQVLVFTRITASILVLNNSTMFMNILHLSATIWIFLFFAWTLKYGKYLLRV